MLKFLFNRFGGRLCKIILGEDFKRTYRSKRHVIYIHVPVHTCIH